MAFVRSVASSNLLNAVPRKAQDVVAEKKMTTRAGSQRAALGNISNRTTGPTNGKSDALKQVLKDKKAVVEKTVSTKPAGAVVTKQLKGLKNAPAPHITQHNEPAIVPVMPVVQEVEEKQVEDICQKKIVPAKQEPILEDEVIIIEESIIENASTSSGAMDISVNSDASDTTTMKTDVAFSNQMYTLTLRDIDEEDADNPQLVSEYAKDIYRYMMALERDTPIKQNHLADQPEVNGRMRAILVDWLVQVHQRFHLLQETLFLSVAVLDRFLQSESVPKVKLQLAGVAAMWIAAKYEEMYAPEVADFAYITDHAYTKTEIRQMECAILRALDFSLGRPLPIHFLRRFSKAGDVDARTHNLAKYFMELALVPCEMAHIKPSFLAAASLRLAQLLLGEYVWGSTMIFYTCYDEKMLQPLMAKIAQIALNAGNGKTTAVRAKYLSSKLMKVSHFDERNLESLQEVSTWPTAPLFQE